MDEKFDLLTTVESGGCSAKLPPAELDLLLRDLPILASERMLVGPDTHDDASVWKIDDETALISTTDFFPPVCSDAYDFGQIAAANSFSDVYAMGGEPISALNILMFPSARINLTVMKEILIGGADKAIEAGAVLSGGHTLDDYPPKYGLAVTGIVHPDRIITNDAARPGQVLILTKPLGTAVVIAGRRLGGAGDEVYQAAVESMKRLNRDAARSMQRHGIRCATDITGFSLLGHALKLAKASGVRLLIDSRRLPMLPGVYDLLDAGCIPGASFRNLRYTESAVDFADSLDYNLKMLAVDAQTSGGILMCCEAQKADEVLAELKVSCPGAVIIGETAPQMHGDSFISLM